MKEVKTHEIDGVTYVEVDRNAKVGDMVWLVNIRDSIKLSEVNNIDGINEDIEHGWVKTLEPTVDTSQASPQVIDMLANLARRVAELERETRLLRRENVIATEGRATTLKNVDTLKDGLNAWIKTVSSHTEQIDTLFRNVETFAEQSESNSEDIRELDSRTQVLDAINKYYAEGSR